MKMGLTPMSNQTLLQEQPVSVTGSEIASEPDYIPKEYVFIGLRIPVTIRNQMGTPMTIFFDTREQVFNFIYGFPSVMQKGQLVQVECDAYGIHGWLHGESPERRDAYGKRIMPTHGDPTFDSLHKSLHISTEVSEEMKAWDEYTAHNREWYLRKAKERYQTNEGEANQ
jgi:hypothetical protein